MDKIGDKRKTKAQLIEELQSLRQQLAESQGREEQGREQVEESSLRERDMLYVLMDNVPDWIFFKDAESRIVRSNRAHAQVLGFDDPREVVGQTDFDLFPREDAQRFYDEEQRMLQSGQSVVARLGQTPSSDGEVLWVSETKIPLKDETGQVIGLVGISRDVTDIKRAEETLKEAHAEIEKQVEARTAELKREIVERERAEAALARESELLQVLLDNSPDYLFFKDRESRFIRTSRAHAQNLLGLDAPQEAVGITDFDLFSQEEAQRFYDEEQRIMETGQPVIGREWSLTSSTTGEEVWLSEHKVPMRDETGQVIGLLGVSRDITTLKQAAAERERLLAVLRQRGVQLRAAADITNATSSMRDPRELVQEVVNLIRERFGLYYVGLFMVDQTSEMGKWAVLQAGTGKAGTKMVKQGHELRVSMGHSMIGECIATGEARVEQDVDRSALHRKNPLLPDTRSELALPLISRGETIGALTVQSAETSAFTEEVVSIMQTMAGQIANAVENAKLYKQTEDALKELETLHRSHVRQSWDSYIRKGR
jgi:PAS domain S-box-containing protein